MRKKDCLLVLVITEAVGVAVVKKKKGHQSVESCFTQPLAKSG